MIMMAFVESKISKFKAQALELFREIEETGASFGTSMIITDHGRPAVEMQCFYDRKLLDVLKGRVIRYQRATRPVAG